VAAWLALASVTTVAAAERPAEIRLGLAELESGLAKKPDLYLELDPAAGHLAIKSRGIELARVPLVAMTRLEFRPLFGGGAAPSLPAPAIWTVAQGPGDTDRETIAPTTLRPYTEEDAKAEPTPSSPGPPPVKKPGEEDKPSSYRVTLDNGWQLLLVNEPPRLGWWRRLVAAVTDGWLRVRGLEPSHPPLVTLVVAPDDARRLHHLFRTGMAILVAPPS
jgi:hypothetical protein